MSIYKKPSEFVKNLAIFFFLVIAIMGAYATFEILHDLNTSVIIGVLILLRFLNYHDKTDLKNEIFYLKEEIENLKNGKM